MSASSSSTPSWSPTVEAIGNITTPGNLYIITPNSGYNNTIGVRLYLLNAKELAYDYSYLNLNITVRYNTTSTSEEDLASSAIAKSYAGAKQTTILSLDKGYEVFYLTAPEQIGAKGYVIRVESGSYYCISKDNSTGSLSPEFYAEVFQV